MCLVCPDECFQAPSVEQCFILLYTWKRSHPREATMSVFETVQMLCEPTLADEAQLEGLAGLSMLNMFTVISGTS